MNSSTPPRQLIFDPPSEVFATDNGGSFTFRLQADSEEYLVTAPYDEVRFVISLWYPATEKVIDLDRAYLELQASLDPAEADLYTERMNLATSGHYQRPDVFSFKVDKSRMTD